MPKRDTLNEATDEKLCEAILLACYDKYITEIGANKADYTPSESLKRQVQAAYGARENSRFYFMFLGFYAGFCLGFETLANIDREFQGQEQPSE